MIDLHSHIIFNVDDGPKNLQESILMVKESYIQGVKKIVATPHYNEKLFIYNKEDILSNFEILKYNVSKLYDDLELYLGSEMYCFDNIKKILEDKNFFTINYTQYILVEFNFKETFRSIYKKLNLILSYGYIPIIAHVERYEKLNIENIKKIIDSGCLIQVNSDSLIFSFKKIKLVYKTRKIVKNRLVHFISSDMHNNTVRKNNMLKSKKILEKITDENFADKVFYENQYKVINGLDLE